MEGCVTSDYKILLIATLAVLGVVPGCSEAGALTVGETYERMLVGMTEEGSVLHTTLSSEVVNMDGVVSTSVEREFWVDVPNNTFREELRFLVEVGLDETSVQIYVDGDLYVLTDSEALRNGVAGRCAGSGSGLLFGYLRCIQLGAYSEKEQDPQVHEDGGLNGEDVVTLVFQMPSQASPQAEQLISELYLDPETFLPIARTIPGLDGDGRGRFLHTFQHEFLPEESLPSDFFEPGPFRDTTGFGHP